MPDTIAAIATAPAAAAVGIVRLSGAETRRVLAALFTPVNGRSAAELPLRPLPPEAVWQELKKQVIVRSGGN